MTIFGTKALALGGLCALLLGAGHAASAQGDAHPGYGRRHHTWQRSADAQTYGRQGAHRGAARARRHLQVLHAVYNHEIKSGHPEAAMQAHLHAKAIRARIRARRPNGG
jgi:hypothetical protein